MATSLLEQRESYLAVIIILVLGLQVLCYFVRMIGIHETSLSTEETSGTRTTKNCGCHHGQNEDQTEVQDSILEQSCQDCQKSSQQQAGIHWPGNEAGSCW